MSTFHRPTPTLRKVASTTMAAAMALTLGLGLAGCENSTSKSCRTNNELSTCEVKVKGNSRVELPSTEPKRGNKKRVFHFEIVSAKAGGEAVFKLGGVEGRCRQGETFSMPNTTVECTHVGDDELHFTYKSSE